MSEARVARIEALLTSAFAPDELLVKDQSHLHAGHAGAQGGGGHFEIRIVATEFRDVGRIQSHRMIYDALAEMMTSEIHALSIRATAPKTDLSG